MAPAPALPSDTVNVRMYHVGFGDCFLLSFPVEGEHRHVLVDCGAHVKGSLGNLPEVAENVSELTGGRLAVVVATAAIRIISGVSSAGARLSVR